MKLLHMSLLTGALLLATALPARAQASSELSENSENSECSMPTTQVLRPVTSTYSLEVGSAHQVDTYLTPMHYDGQTFALSYSRLQAMKFDPARWTQQLYGRLSLDHTQNPVRNATMWGAELNFRWGMFRKISLPWGLSLAPGLMADIRGGALYLSRNGNNPVSAQAAFTIDVSALLAKTVKIGKINIDFTYQPTLPLTGCFFSPDYGELYYEIYLGNHKNLFHGAWPGNYFRLDNLFTADIHLGNTALRLGYSGSIFSSKTNNIVTRHTTHAFVIGITQSWLSVSRHKGCSSKSNSKTYFAL